MMARVPFPAAALAAAALLVPAPSASAAQSSSTTPWATINACDPPQRPGGVGVRVLVPDRRDAAQWARIRMQWFDASRKAWRNPTTGSDTRWRKVSDGGSMVLAGTTFVYRVPRAGTRLKMRAFVQLEWRRGDRVLSRSRVTSTKGHVDRTDPLLQISRATCEITR